MRRPFVALMIVVLLVALIVPSVGCGKEEEAKTLTVAVGQIATQPVLGVFSNDTLTQLRCTGLMMDHLTGMDSDGTLSPGLATAWEVAADKMSITFTLREGVQFHNGWGELTADDVKFTLDRILEPGSDASKYNSNAQSVAQGLINRIETSGSYEVTIYLNRPFPDDILVWLSPYRIGTGITSKKYFDEVGIDQAQTEPVFSGPYQFVDFVLADHLTLKAVQDHWRVKPAFDTVIFKEVPEVMTRVSMVMADEADIAEITVAQAGALSTAQGVSVVRVPDAANLVLYPMGQLPSTDPKYDATCPFLDKRVRQALNLAIDREALAQKIYGGFATPSGGWTNHSGEGQPYAYDLDQAKQLMTEAGYPNGFDMEMWSLDIAGAGMVELQDAYLPIASYWQKLGVNVSLSVRSIMAVYGRILSHDTVGVVFGQSNQRYVGEGAPASAYGAMASRGSYWPIVTNEDVWEMVDALSKVTSQTERTELIDQIAQYVHDEYLLVPLVKLDGVWLTSKGVATWAPWCPANLGLEYATIAKE